MSNNSPSILQTPIVLARCFFSLSCMLLPQIQGHALACWWRYRPVSDFGYFTWPLIPVRQPCAWVMFWDSHIDIRLRLGPPGQWSSWEGVGRRRVEKQQICSRIGWQKPKQCCFSFFRWALLKNEKGCIVWCMGRQTKYKTNVFYYLSTTSETSYVFPNATDLISRISVYSSGWVSLSQCEYLLEELFKVFKNNPVDVTVMAGGLFQEWARRLQN